MNDTHNAIKNGEEAAAGSFGRLTSMTDLPADEILLDFIKQAMALNETGAKSTMRPAASKAPKAEIEVPDYFTAALDNEPEAKATFEGLSSSQQREYLVWVTEAKTDTTGINVWLPL